MAQSHKFRKTKSLFATTLSTGIGTGTGDTITLASVSGLPTDTEITLTFDRVDSTGTATPDKMERITGTISGGSLTSYTRAVDGSTEQAHDAGAVIEYIPNADDINDMVDGILVEHGQDGTHDNTKVAMLAGTQTITGVKTFTPEQIFTAAPRLDAGGKLKQISTPDAPAAGHTLLYGKTDGKIYRRATGGSETEVGAGGGDTVLTPLSAIFPNSNYPALSKTSGTNMVYYTLDFDQTTSESCQWITTIPQSWVTGGTAYIYWTASGGSASQTCNWDFHTKSYANDEAIDAAFNTADNLNDVLIATGDVHVISGSITTTGWAAGELLAIKVARDISDNLAADAKLLTVAIKWS